MVMLTFAFFFAIVHVAICQPTTCNIESSKCISEDKVPLLQEQLEQLKLETTKIKVDKERHMEDSARIKADLLQIKEENVRLTIRIRENEELLSKQTRDIISLSTKQQQSEARLSSEIDTIRSSINSQIIRAVAAKHPNPIVFNARLDQTKDNTFGYGDVVKFPRILVNSGNGYSSTTGKFTCPVRGVYHFDAHLMTSDKYFEAHLRLGGKVISYLLCHRSGFSETEWMLDSAGVNAICEAGEEVYLSPSYPANVEVKLHHTWNYFSGVLISVI